MVQKPSSSKKTYKKFYGKKTYKKSYKMKMNLKNNVVAIKELRDFDLLPNTNYATTNLGLETPRARKMAELFEQYRIVRIDHRVNPKYDSFAVGVTGNGPSTVPYLYWTLDRLNISPSIFDEVYYQSLGVKAIRFDEITVKRSYVPNVILTSAVDSNGIQILSNNIKKSPWLNCDQIIADRPTFTVSTISHHGALMGVYCATGGGATNPVATCEITIHYEFKKPRVPVVASMNAQPTVVVEASDISHNELQI